MLTVELKGYIASHERAQFKYFGQTARYGFLDTSTLMEIYKKRNNRRTDE